MIGIPDGPGAFDNGDGMRRLSLRCYSRRRWLR